MRAITLLLVAGSLLVGCQTAPIVLPATRNPPPEVLVEVPLRPRAGEITSQRDVARFILALDAYSRRLEVLLEGWREWAQTENADGGR